MLLDRVVQVGSLGHEHRRDRAANQDPFGVQVEPSAFELIMVAVAPFQDTPGLVVGDEFHAFEQIVRDLRAAVREALERIERGDAGDSLGAAENHHLDTI